MRHYTNIGAEALYVIFGDVHPLIGDTDNDGRLEYLDSLVNPMILLAYDIHNDMLIITPRRTDGLDCVKVIAPPYYRIGEYYINYYRYHVWLTCPRFMYQSL